MMFEQLNQQKILAGNMSTMKKLKINSPNHSFWIFVKQKLR